MNQRYIVAGIVQSGDRIILGKKAQGQPPYPDVWHTPGGGANDLEKAKRLYNARDYDNEYFHSELARELREELGITVTNIANIVPKYRPVPREDDTVDKCGKMTHYFFLEYLCEYVEGELHPSDDLAEAKWVSRSDLSNHELTPPSQEMYRELGWIR